MDYVRFEITFGDKDGIVRDLSREREIRVKLCEISSDKLQQGCVLCEN